MVRLVSIFGSRQQTRALELLLSNQSKVFSQAGLARELRCSASTVSRVLVPLVELGLVKVDTIRDQMKIVALDAENQRAKLLLEFYEKFRSL